MSLVNKAEAFARKAHEGQMYGSRLYIEHCVEVVQRVNQYRPGDEEYLTTAWLHDVLEDTSTTHAELSDVVGPEIAFSVEQMTGRGANRRARNADIYRKLPYSQVARLVKVCDRIANVQECWRTQDTRLFMYRDEHSAFGKALFPAICDDPCAMQAYRDLHSMLGGTIRLG